MPTALDSNARRMVVGALVGSSDVDEIAARCNQLGVSHVTLHVSGMRGARETGSPNLAALQELQGRLADMGITISAMNQKGHLSGDPDLVLNPSAHRERIDAMLRTIEVQGALGIYAQLHYVAVPEPENPEDDEAYWDGLLAIMRELVAEAETSKVKIGNHGIWRAFPDRLREEALEQGVNHDNYRHFRDPDWGGPFLVRTAEHIRRLIEEVPSDNHGVTMCTGMYMMGADPIQEIARFKGKINFVQIRDLDQRWPEAREVFPGEGDLDFPAILRALRDAGYEGFMHTEHLGRPHYAGEDLEVTSTKFLQAWLAEVQG